jgi:excisionase family DNA binding protein
LNFYSTNSNMPAKPFGHERVHEDVVPWENNMCEKLAYTVAEACSAASIGRTSLYQAIKDGRLQAIKQGRRTLILSEELRRWLDSLPKLPNPASEAA